MAIDYEKSGVSLEAGYEVVRRIKKHVASTNRPGVMGGIGSFGVHDPFSKDIKESFQLVFQQEGAAVLGSAVGGLGNCVCLRRVCALVCQQLADCL